LSRNITLQLISLHIHVVQINHNCLLLFQFCHCYLHPNVVHWLISSLLSFSLTFVCLLVLKTSFKSSTSTSTKSIENLNFILSQPTKQLDMDQLTNLVERYHLSYLLHRYYPEEPEHDAWVWFSLRITNHLSTDHF